MAARAARRKYFSREGRPGASGPLGPLGKMKILVCVTSVPDTTAKISFTDGDTKFNKAGVTYITGPYDDYALSRAIELKEKLGGTVTVLMMPLG